LLVNEEEVVVTDDEEEEDEEEEKEDGDEDMEEEEDNEEVTEFTVDGGSDVVLEDGDELTTLDLVSCILMIGAQKRFRVLANQQRS
jgi:hypothetical protein